MNKAKETYDILSSRPIEALWESQKEIMGEGGQWMV